MLQKMQAALSESFPWINSSPSTREFLSYLGHSPCESASTLQHYPVNFSTICELFWWLSARLLNLLSNFSATQQAAPSGHLWLRILASFFVNDSLYVPVVAVCPLQLGQNISIEGLESASSDLFTLPQPQVPEVVLSSCTVFLSIVLCPI